MITPYSLAEKFIGLKEVPGSKNEPMILEMLQLDAKWPEDDETPWCAAFVNYVCWLAGSERSKSLAARSFLPVGVPITLDQAEPGFDLVILDRPPNPAHGHVGFYAGRGVDADGNEFVLILGGNQGDQVSIAKYPLDRVIGIRRIDA